MAKQLTTTQFFRLFPDDETCLNHLFETRFGQGFTCPSCERPSNWYRIKSERAYSCQWCGYHLHPTVGTPFEQTRTPLQLWFYAIHLFTTTRHGVSGKELERQLGVTYKTAWRMAQLIRQHMADVDGNDPIGGLGRTVQMDETFVGGALRKGKRGGCHGERCRGLLAAPESVHRGDAHSRQRQVSRPLLRRVRVPLQSSQSPGGDASGASFDFPAIACKVALKASASPSAS